MKTLLKPQPGWLVIRPEPLMYGGQITIPENVSATAGDCLQKGRVVETAYPDVSNGDLILYKTHAGVKIKLSDDNLILLGQYDVVGVLA